jgi:hypothetical protein
MLAIGIIEIDGHLKIQEYFLKDPPRHTAQSPFINARMDFTALDDQVGAEGIHLLNDLPVNGALHDPVPMSDISKGKGLKEGIESVFGGLFLRHPHDVGRAVQNGLSKQEAGRQAVGWTTWRKMISALKRLAT